MPSVSYPPPFDAYVGHEPFVFVSYAHKDGVVVFPRLSALHAQGYRIWYDEGIDPGNEWPEEIAAALLRASWFLVFISASAIGSANVRNEINFALSRSKPFLAVYIEDVSLPPGLELRMGSIQAIHQWRMDEEQYHRKLAKALPSELRISHRVGEPHLSVSMAETKEGGIKDTPPLARDKQITNPSTAQLPIRVGSIIENDGHQYEVLRIVIHGSGVDELGTASWVADEGDRLHLKRLNDGYTSIWTSCDTYRKSNKMKYGFDQILKESSVVRY